MRSGYRSGSSKTSASVVVIAIRHGLERQVPQIPSGKTHDRVTLHAKVAALSSPCAYPDKPSRVDKVETHKSWVFLTDTKAYKLKKPVRYNAVNLDTLERRRQNCREEVRLNRRLAADVYLGIAPLTAHEQQGLTVNGTGEVVDWLVTMRRLPADRMLDNLILCGKLSEADVSAVARLLSDFYLRSQPAEISPLEYRERLKAGILENQEEIGRAVYRLPEDTVQLIHTRQFALLEGYPQLFDARVDAGRVVEGHGDLRAGHVCLEKPPVIFDCLEFDRHLRIVDAVDELAFLALECERLGASWAGPLLFEIYEHMTADHPPPQLVDFYKSYRASVWARLALWRTHEIERAEWSKWLSRATEYLYLADIYSQSLQLTGIGTEGD